MVEFILRGMFLVTAAAVAALFAVRTFVQPGEEGHIFATIGAALLVAAGLVLLDIATPKKKLSAVAGMFLGLIVGMLATYALSFLVAYVVVLFPMIPNELVTGLTVFIGVICVFGSISLILQTKDDFRFVIPYVEFAKQIRGNRPMLLDSSAIIDGRILDVADTHLLQGQLVVPRFVVNELQTIADSSDKIKRARGRRGLDIVAKLQNHAQVDLSIEDADAEGASVDQKLVALADNMHALLVTTDYNLAKVAQLRGVDVVNFNDLAEAMRPVVLPGETMGVQIIKPGEGQGQGVGYLEDGTMVVVEQAADRLGDSVTLRVTSVLQTSAGRMVFGRLDGQAEGPNPARADRPAQRGGNR